MGLINKPWTPSSGDTIDATNYNSNLDTIYNEFNGNIDLNNIKSSIINAANGLLQLDSNGDIPSTVAWGAIPSGTKMIFAQATAPTGWTQDTSINDKVLRVVDGQGGGTGGSWTISGLSTGSAGSHYHTQGKTGSAGSHTHSQGSTGSAGGHTHTYSGNTDTDNTHKTNSGHDYSGTYKSTPSHYHAYSGTTSSNGSHTHTNPDTNSAGSHTHSNPNTSTTGSHTHSVSSDGSWKPPYLDIIIATKD